MRALIDTCVVVDALQSRKPFGENAEKILLLSAIKAYEGFITAKSVADIYYLLHKATHSDEESRQLLGKLFTLFSVLDTPGRACVNALASPIGDYEDALMGETARLSEIDCIVTRNKQDYRKSRLKILAPEEFIAMF